MSERDWARALTALRAELDADLAIAGALRSLAARQETLDAALADLDGMLGRVERAAVVVLVGPTGAGKSTLLNALVGQEIALEGALRPTTSRPVIHAPVDADLGELLAGLPGSAPEVVRYTPTAAGPFAGQVLIDAPDVNSVERAHRDVVAALAERADVLVVVLKAESVVEEATLSFLDGFRGRRELLLVLGRADELAEVAQREVLEQIRAVARERLGVEDAVALPICARDAREGRAGARFGELVAAIERLADGAEMGRIRRDNSLGSVAALAVEVRAVQESGAALERAVARQGEAIEVLARETGGEVAHRISLRRGEVSEHLSAEVGRGWSGPVGWTLRAGRLPVLGLGGAALVARRNPYLAAGSALVGAVAGQIQGRFSRRRLQDTTELLPQPSALVERWTELGVDARLELARLVVPERLLELTPPSVDMLHERLSRVAAESWNTLIARDLKQAVSRVFGPARRFGLDLVPLAFLGWMGWRAAHGFFVGRYLGVDFLLNGLFLLATLLLLLRMGVGRWLDRTSVRLLADAGRRAADGISRAARAASEPPIKAARAVREALDRLSALDERWRSRLHAPPRDAIAWEGTGAKGARQPDGRSRSRVSAPSADS